MIDRLLVFGAGDLTRRYLLPAVASLTEEGTVGDQLRIAVVARSEQTTEAFRDQVVEAFGSLDRAVPDGFLDRIERIQGDVSSPEDVRELVADGTPVVAYLALPPPSFAPAIEAFARAGLPDGSRIVVEKPFGTSRESAHELNELLHRTVPEDAVFRIDHFLGMRTAHNVAALRFANRLFEPAWCAEHIERIDIVWDETKALDGRAKYYDGAGAARDMIQNHLLQLLSLVAMEPPASLSSEDLGDAKVAVLEATRPADARARSCSIRGRYTAGEVKGKAVPSYVDEDGVDPGLGTETFAQITFLVDTPRWRGVPFVLRSGKALAEERHDVVVTFRAVEGVRFDVTEDLAPNILRFTVRPDGMALALELASKDEIFSFEQMDVSHLLGEGELTPYALLLRDILDGGSVLSVRDDEVEAAWAAIEPVLSSWDDEHVPLVDYEAGSDGPALAERCFAAQNLPEPTG